MTLNTNRNNAGRGLLEKNPQSFVMMKGRITRTRSHDITIYAYNTDSHTHTHISSDKQYTLNLMRFSALRSNGRRNATLKWTKDALRIGIYSALEEETYTESAVTFVVSRLLCYIFPKRTSWIKVQTIKYQTIEKTTPVELVGWCVLFPFASDVWIIPLSCLFRKNAHHIVSTILEYLFGEPMILFVWTLALTVLAYIIWILN